MASGRLGIWNLGIHSEQDSQIEILPGVKQSSPENVFFNQDAVTSRQIQ